MSNATANLPDDPAFLKAMIAALLADNAKMSATLQADFDESGQRFQQVADNHFAKSRTAGSIEFRQPGCCQG